MAIEPTLQSVLDATQSLFRNQLGNAAQSAQADSNRSAVQSTQSAADQASQNQADTDAGSTRDDDTVPRNQGRGSTLDLNI